MSEQCLRTAIEREQREEQPFSNHFDKSNVELQSGDITYRLDRYLRRLLNIRQTKAVIRIRTTRISEGKCYNLSPELRECCRVLRSRRLRRIFACSAPVLVRPLRIGTLEICPIGDSTLGVHAGNYKVIRNRAV